MIPDQTKRVQAERRIQSAANRSTFRGNKPKQPVRKKQNADNKDFELLKVKINALTTLFKVFSKSENKGRVALYIGNCLASYANPTRSQTKSQKRSLLRKANKISTPITLGQLMINTLKICPQNILLIKKQLCSQRPKIHSDSPQTDFS